MPHCFSSSTVTIVETVRAIDSDPADTPNGMVYYKWESEFQEGSTEFAIDETSGAIQVRSGVTFDYDLKNKYIMRVCIIHQRAGSHSSRRNSYAVNAS